MATVRLATFNLEELDDVPNKRPTLAERIRVMRPQLERINADVLCLQEAHGQGQANQPKQLLALDQLRKFRAASGGQIPLIGVGGIENADDAWERIRAGASLIQLYSAMVYEGPGIAMRIAQGLAQRLKRDGMSNIADAVGLLGAALYCDPNLYISVTAYLSQSLQTLTVGDIGQGLAKSLVFAELITLIGVSTGFGVSGGAEGVGRATTRAVVLSISSLVVADMIFGYFMNR